MVLPSTHLHMWLERNLHMIKLQQRCQTLLECPTFVSFHCCVKTSDRPRRCGCKHDVLKWYSSEIQIVRQPVATTQTQSTFPSSRGANFSASPHHLPYKMDTIITQQKKNSADFNYKCRLKSLSELHASCHSAQLWMGHFFSVLQPPG